MAVAWTVVQTFAALAVGFVGLLLIRHGLVLVTSSQGTFAAAQQAGPKTTKDALSGNIDPTERQQRDYALSAGMAVDLKTGKIMPQGRLSDEMVEGLI